MAISVLTEQEVGQKMIVASDSSSVLLIQLLVKKIINTLFAYESNNTYAISPLWRVTAAPRHLSPSRRLYLPLARSVDPEGPGSLPVGVQVWTAVERLHPQPRRPKSLYAPVLCSCSGPWRLSGGSWS